MCRCSSDYFLSYRFSKWGLSSQSSCSGQLGLHSVTPALQFPWALKSSHQHYAKYIRHLQLLWSIPSFVKCLINYSKKLLTPFLTMNVSVQNPHISKVSLIQFYVPSTLTPNAGIHGHTCSPDFCLNELANSISSAVV